MELSRELPCSPLALATSSISQSPFSNLGIRQASFLQFTERVMETSGDREALAPEWVKGKDRTGTLHVSKIWWGQSRLPWAVTLVEHVGTGGRV